IDAALERLDPLARRDQRDLAGPRQLFVRRLGVRELGRERALALRDRLESQRVLACGRAVTGREPRAQLGLELDLLFTEAQVLGLEPLDDARVAREAFVVFADLLAQRLALEVEHTLRVLRLELGEARADAGAPETTDALEDHGVPP